jgi:hypothetical protein
MVLILFQQHLGGHREVVPPMHFGDAADSDLLADKVTFLQQHTGADNTGKPVYRQSWGKSQVVSNLRRLLVPPTIGHV